MLIEHGTSSQHHKKCEFSYGFQFLFQVAIFEISWAFLFLISASLVAEVANYFGVLKAHVGVKQFYNTMATAVVSP